MSHLFQTVQKISHEGDIVTSCIDIDECVNPDACSESESLTNCLNTIGSYQCACAEGFQQVPYLDECQNLNECLVDAFDCNRHQFCVDTYGSYECQCKPGFNRVGSECFDVDECKDRVYFCYSLSKRLCYHWNFN